MTDRKRTFKLAMTILVLLGLAALAVLFLQLRQQQQKPLPLPDIAKDAVMSLARLHQTATKDGKVQWEMDADSAQLEEGGTRMILNSPSVVFYMDDGGKVLLTAEKGMLNTRSNNMQVSGNVQVHNDRYKLKTESLAYDHENRILKSITPVVISSRQFDLQADQMTYDLDRNQASFDGRVKGRLNERPVI